ncbi:MAG: HEAT repeat domain-containing protein, partial [Elusimicrobia bacterium]|nr:HEAT repeat domain-containing protein [Elusimicrobiota bacterium]
MHKALALVVFLAAAAYLAREYIRPPAPPPLPAEPPVAAAMKDPGPAFSEREVAKVRQSLTDPDPAVRWAAVQLLYNVRDPKLGPALEKMISDDPDPEVRIKIVGMMKGREELVR